MSLQRSMDGDTLVLSENEKKILIMEEEQQDRNILVHVTGSLRNETVHTFLDEITAFVVLGYTVRLDFSKVTYLASSCIQALLTIQQKIDSMGQGELVLMHVPAEIYKSLENTGISQLLLIEN